MRRGSGGRGSFPKAGGDSEWDRSGQSGGRDRLADERDRSRRSAASGSCQRCRVCLSLSRSRSLKLAEAGARRSRAARRRGHQPGDTALWGRSGAVAAQEAQSEGREAHERPAYPAGRSVLCDIILPAAFQDGIAQVSFGLQLRMIRRSCELRTMCCTVVCSVVAVSVANSKQA